MKVLFTMVMMYIYAFSNAQDTVFIKRVITDTPYAFYHAIFIDQSDTSSFRKRITEYRFDHFDSSTYFDGLHCLERPVKKVYIQPNKELPRNWVPLYRYQGRYYTYHASDGCCIFRFRITDTTTIDHTVEGPEPSWIKSIKNNGKGKFTIERNSRYGSDKVTIQIIHKKHGIAIINFTQSKYSSGRKILMVDAAKAHLFPTIVNYCPTNRVEELTFDSSFY
jgi:hypothetical protein